MVSRQDGGDLPQAIAVRIENEGFHTRRETA